MELNVNSKRKLSFVCSSVVVYRIAVRVLAYYYNPFDVKHLILDWFRFNQVWGIDRYTKKEIVAKRITQLTVSATGTSLPRSQDYPSQYMRLMRARYNDSRGRARLQTVNAASFRTTRVDTNL